MESIHLLVLVVALPFSSSRGFMRLFFCWVKNWPNKAINSGTIVAGKSLELEIDIAISISLSFTRCFPNAFWFVIWSKNKRERNYRERRKERWFCGLVVCVEWGIYRGESVWWKGKGKNKREKKKKESELLFTSWLVLVMN